MYTVVRISLYWNSTELKAFLRSPSCTGRKQARANTRFTQAGGGVGISTIRKMHLQIPMHSVRGTMTLSPPDNDDGRGGLIFLNTSSLKSCKVGSGSTYICSSIVLATYVNDT